MTTIKPELQNYGITSEQYDLYHGTRLKEPSLLASLVALTIIIPSVLWVVFTITGDWAWAIGSALILSISPLPGCLVTYSVAWLVESAIVGFKRFRLLRSTIASRIKLYEEAVSVYRISQEQAERAQQEVERHWQETETARQEADWLRREAEGARRRRWSEYWMSLSGTEFEQELGKLYEQQGYHVQRTPASGDQGVDLILIKEGKKTVVQCKAHKAPVGPAIVRELYGSMVAFHAENAILACTGGFTKGVREFAKGKPIELKSASELATMADSSEHDVEYEEPSLPTCPNPRCGRAMRLRSGRLGRFWGCLAYPICTETRSFGLGKG